MMDGRIFVPGASQQQAGASEVAGRAHRPEAPPSSPTAATATAEVQAAPPIPTPTPEPGAAAATTTTITAMPGAVVGQGGVQIGAGGGDGGDRKAAVSAAGILTRLISAMVPELVRAAKVRFRLCPCVLRVETVATRDAGGGEGATACFLTLLILPRDWSN